MPPKLKAASKTETVKVVVRCRPPNKNQLKDQHDFIVQVHEDQRRIDVKNPNPEKSNMPAIRDFTFDSVFAPTCKQSAIFEDTALPIIQSVLEGYNGTIFAYGQTGTGKTHTMEGGDGQQQGIVPRAIKYIFQAIQGAAHTKKYLVRITFLELYNEELIDLLVNPQKAGKEKDKKQLEIHERPGEGIKVYGLSEFVIENEKQITNKYNVGKNHRVVAETKMNSQSSRSHSIFSIIIENQEQVNGKLMTRAGKLNLVDLAGSERQSKTGVTGVEREQAININLSLTTLGLVIQTLVNPKSTHIPYRDSKLTRLLQDSLGGNTKTVMIANIGPSAYNYDETISTLKYANRAKNIKNDVRINEDPKDALLRQFQEEIKRLREQVAQSLGGQPGAVYEKIIEEEDVEGLQENLRNEQEIIKKKFDQEKAEIYKNKAMLEQERNKILKEIEQKEKEQQLYKQNQQALIKKLKKMQEKVLHGNEQEEAAIQKADQLKRKLQQLQEKRENQRIIEEDLKEKEDIMDNANKMYKSLQQENEDKSLQIKQKLRRLKNLENQNKELEEMYAEEIEALQQRRRILQKELKLKNFVIDYFVPAEYIEMIHDKVIWNQELDDWFLPNLDISGNSLRHKNPEKFNQNEELTEEDIEEMKLNEFVKQQLDNHPNVYYTYSEQGLVRQLEPQQKKPKKIKKRPQSKRKA